MYETSPGLGIDPLAPADDRRILYEIIRTVSSTRRPGAGARGGRQADRRGREGAVVLRVDRRARRQPAGPARRLRAVHPRGRQGHDAAPARASRAGSPSTAGRSFIPYNALADPRTRYFPEFEEEKYQSIVSVPLIGKDDEVFGVIGLHSAGAAHADGGRRHVRDPLGIAGGRARSRTRASTRRAPTRARAGAAVGDLRPCGPRPTPWPSCCRRCAEAACDLLDADQVCVYAVERGERLVPARGGAPPRARRRRTCVAAAIDEPAGAPSPAATCRRAPSRCRSRSTARRSGHVVALRASFAFDAGELDLLGTVAAQTAVGWKKIELIDGLTERNLTKDFFGDLAAGRLDGAEGRARRLGCDLDQPRLAVVVLPHDAASRPRRRAGRGVERFEAEVGRELAGAVFDRRDDRAAASCPCSAATARASLERLPRRARRALPLVVGVSNPATGAEGVAAALEEAQQAARAAPVSPIGRRRHVRRARPVQVPAARAVAGGRARPAPRGAAPPGRLRPRRGGAELCRTLEEYLRQRGNISATAQALYVHPNTLRQRLRRIEEITGLDVRDGDWLMIEIALKLLRLEELVELGGAGPTARAAGPAPGQPRAFRARSASGRSCAGRRPRRSRRSRRSARSPSLLIATITCATACRPCAGSRRRCRPRCSTSATPTCRSGRPASRTGTSRRRRPRGWRRPRRRARGEVLAER